MNMLVKGLTGVAAAVTMAMTAAAPAQAQYYGRSYDRYYDDDDIDVGDIAAGIAIIGGVALAIDALDGRGGYGYPGYGAGYGYGSGYPGYGYGQGGARAAVNACGRVAQRYGNRVEITDIDRRGRDSFRVRGRVVRADYDYDYRWGRRYRDVDYDRERFTCHARYGRVYDFRV